MRDLKQVVRDAISGMFTANITEDVVKRIVQAIVSEKPEDSSGKIYLYTD